MWLTDVSIRRPVFITMVVLALIVLGLFSRGKMPAELNPKVDFPFITIVTVYPGAGPEEMETLVTKPIEEAVGSTSGLKNITSNSQDGVSAVFMEFELGTPVDVAAADVRDKLSSARGNIPKDANEPIVTKADISAQPIMTLAVNPGTSGMSGKDMRILADKTIKDKLAKISGVASISVNGGEEREVRVAIDRDSLQAYGLSIDQIAQAMSAANLNVPSGSIKEGASGLQARDFPVRTVGEYKNADEISDTRLSIPARGGSPAGTIRLGDIAKVTDTITEASVVSRLNGQPSVIMAIQKQSDANTVTVADSLKKEIALMNGYTKVDAGKKEYIKGTLPTGVKLVTTTDDSKFVLDSLDDVNRALIEGIILVVLIVFLFLHSLRATFIVALAIPTSLMATYLPMWAFGFTINFMTMLALTLCVGILVDDSIVVLENIERHVRRGEAPRDAALSGRSEIGLAAMTITLVDVVVFVPIAFMGGIVGMFFRQFGITVAIATLFSLFMSFTLTPMLASRWLKSKEEEEEDEAAQKKGFVAFQDRVFGGIERFFGAVDHGYRGVLAWALQNRPLTIAIGALTLFGVVGLNSMVPVPGRIIIALVILAYVLLATTRERPQIAVMIGILPAAAALGAIKMDYESWPTVQLVILALLVTGAILTLIKGRSKVHMVALLVPLLLGILALGAARFVSPMLGMMIAGAIFGTFMISAIVVSLILRGTPARMVGLGYAVFIALLLILVKFPLGGEFIPSVDRGQFSAMIELPAGSGLDSTDRVARQVEAILSKLPGREFYQATVGSGSAGSFLGGGSSGPQYANVSVKLKDKGPERPMPIEEVMDDVNAKTALISGAIIRIAKQDNVGGGGQPIQEEVTGNNMADMTRVANTLVARMKTVRGLIDVKNSWDAGRPELRIIPDRQRLADMGMTVAQVASAVRTSIEGDTNSKLRDAGEEYDIRVQLANFDRNNSADVGDIIVGQDNGTPVYLRDVARIEQGTAPNKIDRKNRQRLITVGANLATGYTLNNVQADVDKALTGVPTGSTVIKTGGTSQFSEESNGYLVGALLLAIFLVYMLMGALFESFVTPLVIMFSLPQAMIGAMLALMMTGKTFSIISMIGIIMLVGLVTKNAILLVDYTNTLRSRGKLRDEAILEAGPTRLRPILMTTLAMVGGMAPTALAFSRGSEQRQPMAIAVIGGLLLSTMLTLLVIPTVYAVVDDWVAGARQLLGMRRRRQPRHVVYMPDDKSGNGDGKKPWDEGKVPGVKADDGEPVTE